MFPTFISILDIQSWWEVPSIAHFCSLFRGPFNLLDFDIEDLEEALLSDGTEEGSPWLQDLIVRLVGGCLGSNDVSTFNYQMFLRRLFRQKCAETNRFNPFNTDIDFQFLPLRTKVQILHALCDFRLDSEDVLESLKNLEADSLRVEPLGYDENDSAYWYFYGTRLYREDYPNNNRCRKSGKTVWQVICFTEDDWHHVAKKFKESSVKSERKLYKVLQENFLPDLPRLFHEKEVLHRKRLLEWLPRRTTRLDVKRQQNKESELPETDKGESDKETEKEKSRKKRKSFEKSKKRKSSSSEDEVLVKKSRSESRHEREMAERRKQRELRALNREKSRSRTGSDTDSIVSRATTPALNTSTLGVGRQTNNSLASATGDQIVIQSVSNPNRKKLKTSQVFRQSDEDLQTGMYKILENVKNHEDAWPFVDPVEEEYAPNYYSVIRKPMDLQRMEDKLDAGEYLTFSKFKADFQLIVDNCRQYNGSDNEYTEMVGTLQDVFQKATDRYLDQVTSSDEEIAVEFQETSRDSKGHSSSSSQTTTTKKKKEPPSGGTKRKSTGSTTQVEKRRSVERSPSVASSKKSEVVEEKIKIEKKTRSKTQNIKPTTTKVTRSTEAKKEIKNTKVEIKTKKNKKVKQPSPVRQSSPSWPPSSPENKSDNEHVTKVKEKRKDWKDFFKDKKNNKKETKPEVKIEKKVLKPKEDNKVKEKNSKLRETIEKLKAKSDLSDDFLKTPKKEIKKEIKKEVKKDKTEEKEEIVEKIEKPIKKPVKNKFKIKEEKPKDKKCEYEFEDELSEKEDTTEKKTKKPVKKPVKNVSDIDALDAATEQTLKDINKWLDDTPKFSEFSSASNSPSHFIGAEETDVGIKIEQDYRKNLKLDKPRKDGQKDLFKRRLAQLKDSSKIPKRREVQRTIDRLQPGKSKGNLLSNMQNMNKPEELFPLGPLSKLRESKNSLVTKTDDTGPKLSLGTVLDSFGQHNFSEEKEKIPKIELEEEPTTEIKEDTPAKTEEVKTEEAPPKEVEEVKPEQKEVKKEKPQSATPNLSAWFKAFGAPKPAQKKKTEEPEVKEPETPVPQEPKPATESKPESPRKVVSPEPESPQPTRQRRGSTGSSMSERSSFSQDMDSSPRMTMDERLGAYPAPYPSPLHRSPVSASPVMASPRQEENQRAPYPALNGSIRVGFYQDTVSTKSSPDKSCSPRDQPQSPYQQYSEHVYTPPNTMQQSGNYSYSSNPYYNQNPPTYANTNPPPAYTERSSTYFDTTKPLTDQYNAKTPQPYQSEENKSPELEFKANDEFRQLRVPEKTTFPVKKRLYNETDNVREELQIETQENRDSAFTNRLEQNLMTGRQLNLGIGTQQLSPAQESPREKQFTQERQEVVESPTYQRPESRDLNLAINKTFDNMKMYNTQVEMTQQIDMQNMRMNYQQDLNIQNFDTLNRNENTRDGKFDMKLGYLNPPNVDLTRTTQYQGINHPKPKTTEIANPQPQNVQNEHMNLSMYQDRLPSHPMAYPTRSEPQVTMSSNQEMLQMGQNRVQNIPNRTIGVDMSNANYKTDMTIPRPAFNTSTTLGMEQMGIRGNLANISHIVDRFPTDDRLLNLQNSSYYSDKGLSHMFKSIPTTLTSSASTSNLPMFSQPMYRGEIQQSNMGYIRPTTELQNQLQIPQSKSPQLDKKARKRKTKNEVSTAQGFQSYAGLKNTVSTEPSAISLKTASVVPGSAFNFGPTGPGLGLSSWVGAEKDTYPGYLDEYRPNYFLGQRTPENSTEKPVRQAHQQNASFPFLGHQPRAPGYPMSQFMTPHQVPLMDPSNPLYQQYLHSAGVLHQGLLSSPTGYPAGYHPALSMRQPYDSSLTRPPWL